MVCVCFQTRSSACVAVRLLAERGEEGQTYTVFSASQAATARIQHDGRGPARFGSGGYQHGLGPFPARKLCHDSVDPAHAGIEGNEHADSAAKQAAEGRRERASPEYLGEASLSHLARKTTEAQPRASSKWIRGHIRGE